MQNKEKKIELLKLKIFDNKKKQFQVDFKSQLELLKLKILILKKIKWE